MINMKIRIRYWIPKNCNYSVFWIGMWLWGTEPRGSLQEQQMFLIAKPSLHPKSCMFEALNSLQAVRQGSSESLIMTVNWLAILFCWASSLLTAYITLTRDFVDVAFQVAHTSYLNLLPKSVSPSVTFKLKLIKLYYIFTLGLKSSNTKLRSLY